MGILDFFKGNKEEDQFDPLKDLELSKLKVGYYLDYDMKTWKVTAYNRYDYGEGYYGDEWELTSGNEKVYLGRDEDDEVVWTLSKKLPIGAIEGDIRQHIMETEDPPNQIVVKGKTFYLEESGSAYMHPNGEGEGIGFIGWDFIDENDENVVSIEQWAESEFEASEGFYVEEYQFSNILPSEE
ncbi:MAG: DUF4178 domain-containing protein [Calditrichae bacterium]|nr:DUF4178 domain-containing protein [Calditrichia bacterium]